MMNRSFKPPDPSSTRRTGSPTPPVPEMFSNFKTLENIVRELSTAAHVPLQQEATIEKIFKGLDDEFQELRRDNKSLRAQLHYIEHKGGESLKPKASAIENSASKTLATGNLGKNQAEEMRVWELPLRHTFHIPSGYQFSGEKHHALSLRPLQSSENSLTVDPRMKIHFCEWLKVMQHPNCTSGLCYDFVVWKVGKLGPMEALKSADYSAFVPYKDSKSVKKNAADIFSSLLKAAKERGLDLKKSSGSQCLASTLSGKPSHWTDGERFACSPCIQDKLLCFVLLSVEWVESFYVLLPMEKRYRGENVQDNDIGFYKVSD